MNEKQFRSIIDAANTHSFLTYDPCVMEFWTGYIQGVSRLFYGDKFGTEEGHAEMMASVKSKEETIQRRGAGYVAGFTGVSIEDAMIMAEEGRIMPP